MVLHVPPNGPAKDIASVIERLRRLLADLERIEAGWRPTLRDLGNAPHLEDWQIVHRMLPSLAGVVHEHPVIADGHRTLTSDLWLIAPELGFARTFSRFYRLGQPEADD
ncbi:DUF6634 family protein [Mangrovibrevibacter kandeliae]|uniref:DUF6634 family protein n=1 Tax=Mangrovibrevibacter kandeliae TaxID=2968473 RepID=UPI002117B51C|nr:DUF6634 family protein [Aurantimonas sp. CSK15Z-1]MCQ8782915.1 hypothetical protein [Aurantimonas sp. CSK15Z-1]